MDIDTDNILTWSYMSFTSLYADSLTSSVKVVISEKYKNLNKITKI